MQISIKSDIKSVMRDLDAIERKVLPRALDRSINRIGGTANTLLRRGIAKEAGITQAKLKTRGFFSQVRSTIRTLTFSLIVKYGSIPLKDFNPRQTKQGVTAKAWNTRKVYDGAFVVDSLGRHVFVRKTKKRLPIKKLYGPIPARLAEEDSITSSIQSMIKQKLPTELFRNIEYYARRELKRGGGR